MLVNRFMAVVLWGAVCWGQSPPAAASKEMSHGDHMEHRFDHPEQYAKSFDDPARDAWQMPDKVIAALHLKSGQSVADIGAGTGYFTVRLAQSDAGLKNVVAVQAASDAANLPEPVDAILIVDTYHHIGNREAYFRKVGKSLKPGGRVAIIDFRPDSPEGPPKEFRFPPEKVKAELAKAGYALAEQLDYLPRQQFLIFRLAGSGK
jgi:predicted methyltransferase